nr:unnamed protein product [Digitaria exilis]
MAEERSGGRVEADRRPEDEERSELEPGGEGVRRGAWTWRVETMAREVEAAGGGALHSPRNG